jgi:vancomycin resistance protein YoaR
MHPEAPPPHAPSGPRRRALRWAGGVLGVLALLWVAAYLLAGSGIPRGTTVHGVPIGGLSAAAAEQRLTQRLAAPAASAMPVRVDDQRLTLDPVAAGLSFDARGTVDRAGHRTWNPVTLVRGFFSGAELEPSIHVDEAKLRTAVSGLAAKIDGKPAEGGVRFEDGSPVPVRPRSGRMIDREEATETIRTSYLQVDRPIELTTEVVKPKVEQAEVDRAIKEFGTPAMSAPVDVVVAGKTVPVTPETLSPYLTMAPDGAGRLQPAVDGPGLKKALTASFAPVEVRGRDATFRISSGRPVVVPAKPGREVDPTQLGTRLIPALTESGAQRRAEVGLTVAEPKLTTEAAKALGVTELVSKFTTFYPSDFPPRLINIHRAADLMDNTLVLPGKNFSLNKSVGERTAARGFAAGFIISGGKLEVDFGGGVSQLATTTFNAAFFAGLKDVEHHPHSFYISRYPDGREATVAWGFKDLRFRNDSPHGIFVTTSWTAGSVTVRIYGTKRFRIESVKGPRFDVKPFKVVQDKRPAGIDPGDCVATEGVPGFRVVVTRLFLQGGTRVRSEKFRTKYAPENEVRCGG